MEQAVQLAIGHNRQIAAQRMNIDISKADEITAALKPNPVFTSTNADFPLFSPSQLTLSNIANTQSLVESFSYLFERGGKRRKRTLVAQGATDVVSKTVTDAERQLRFGTQQAFINVLLAKSTLDLAHQDLTDFSNVVDVNRARLNAGDLAEADFDKVSLEKLQFEQDVAGAEMALTQAKTALRQAVGFDSVLEDFDVAGELAYTKYTVTLDDLKREALATRPDLQAAQRGIQLAKDTEALARSNRTRDVTGEVEYDRTGPFNGLGFGVTIDLPFHDRNQGNIAHSQIAVRQAIEAEAGTQFGVLTDVTNAYAAFQTSEKIVALYQSGYLDQAQQSLQIATFVNQNGSGTLLDFLDAERTYRATQLAFRQALAAFMTSVQQLNFVVGKQVVP
jgi:cobalt-zinc-cadmium efflux system outer membrane protein